MWYWICRGVAIFILKLFFRFEVEGFENIPKKTNFIVVANHNSFLDPLVLGAAIPQKVNWIALRGIYNIFWIKWIMNITESLPTGSASNKAIYLLLKNKNVGLFPEGTRSYDGKLREFRRGAALLAIKTGRPILPCAILGTYEALPRRVKLPKFVPIKVKIGKPQYLMKEFEDVIDDIYLQEGTFRIRNTIKDMIANGKR
jgi:1-acyl-sn-glycerol-3-phosphate acyltransferase